MTTSTIPPVQPLQPLAGSRRVRNARFLQFLGCSDRTMLRRLDDDFDPDAETMLTAGHWQYRGRGHTAGHALCTRTIAEETAGAQRLARLAQVEELEEPA